MGTFTIYKESLFSENLRKVTYSANAGDVVTARIVITWFVSGKTGPDRSEFSYDLTIPSTGNIDFYISDILRPFMKKDYEIPPANTSFQNPSISICVSDQDGEEEVWNRDEIIIGGYDDRFDSPADETVVERIFHTARPQTDDTVPGLRQILVTPARGSVNDSKYNGKDIMCKVWLKNLTPVTFRLSGCVWQGLRPTGGAVTYYDRTMVVVDYDKVRNAADTAGIEDEIVAYDVWGEVEDTSTGETLVNCPYPQRFVVRRPRGEWSYFLFQNRLSGIDTLIARGRTKVSEEGEPETFTNDGREYETNNDSKTYYQTNTGYIRSREYRDMWFDFFKSPLHYRTWLDGDVREIILDEWTAEYDDGGELSSFTFKYHYVERDMAVVTARGELEDYYQEIPAV